VQRAHRQRRTDRLASRRAPQTGQRCSYFRLARRSVTPDWWISVAGSRVRGSNPARRTNAAHSLP
jgi:hypothetical protein